MNNENNHNNPAAIECIVFDFGFTLSSDLYFKVSPPEYPNFQELIQQQIFSHDELVSRWMAGAITIHNIAEELAPIVHLDVPKTGSCSRSRLSKSDVQRSGLEFCNATTGRR